LLKCIPDLAALICVNKVASFLPPHPAMIRRMEIAK